MPLLLDINSAISSITGTSHTNGLFLRWTILYNANQDRSVNQQQDMEQLRKELKKWEGEGKAKKVDIGDADEYQVCKEGALPAVFSADSDSP